MEGRVASFYLTTPIYYVNGRPHIGHAYTTVVADALARWHRLIGDDVFLLTGTDEHGQKVLDKANARGLDPKTHADDLVATAWKPVMERLGISYDIFMRTTEPWHGEAVQAVLTQLHAQGLLYQDTYVGWYSPAAERFWTEKDLIDGKCPETGLPVQRVEENNWFFRMSQFQERLIAHIEANPGYIQPANRRNEVLGFLRKELGDLCISRPKARMSWGIEIPFDRDYVTYVWFDALLNYVTAIGYRGEGVPERWPANVQLVGKDILTTHAVYWSTMLMALELPLPQTIFAHGWWVSADGQKMSKSLGNTIDVDLLVDAFGTDALRFFLLKEIAFGEDGKFSYDGFLKAYNADLANDLGNLAHRGLSMIGNWLGGVVPAYGPETGFEAPIVALAGDVVRRFADGMNGLRPQAAMEALAELVRAGNKYVDDTKPWALNKEGSPTLTTSLRTVLELSYIAATLLLPVTPAKAGELLAKLGRSPQEAAADLCRWLAEGVTLRALPDGGSLTVGDPLFPRLREMPTPIVEELARIAALAAEQAPPPPKKAEKKAKPVFEQPAEIAYEDFAKIKLRSGVVRSAEKHPSAERLLVLQVDIGEDKPRQIVAGIASKFAPEALVGRSVVVVANLAPAKLRGVESQGMLLAAGADEVIDLVGVGAGPGEVVR